MKIAITTALADAKVNALKQYMGKKDCSLESEFDSFLEKLYEKYVPPQVREFLDFEGEPQQLPQKAPKVKLSKAMTAPSEPVASEG